MYSKIVNQAPLTLVTLSEAKEQCRVTHAFDDALITRLILVAADLAQSYTRRMLTVGSAVAVFESGASTIQLPYGEATAVTEILLDDVISTDFTFEPVTQKVTINPFYNKAKITFTAGYTTIPDSVKHAILMTVSTLYSNRDNFVTGLSIATLPYTSEVLLNRVRYYAT